MTIQEQTYANDGVPGVLGVPPSNGAACSRNTKENTGVLGVPEPQPSNDAALGENTSTNGGVPGVPSQGLQLQLLPCDPADSMDVETLKEPSIQRPSFVTHDDYFLMHGEQWKAGLYHHGMTKGSEDRPPEPVDTWICTPIHCIALTCDERGASHGVMLRIKNTRGQWVEWVMPMHMLKGSGEELRGELLNLGWRHNTGQAKTFTNWLLSSYPKEKLTAANCTGWHDQNRAFVFPDHTIGNQEYRFQSEHAVHDYFQQKGDLAGWRDTIGALCSGNPLLILGVCTGLAGPLLLPAKQQTAGGSGLNLKGKSSRGKTTILQVVGSLYGPPEFVRTWAATGNGLEAVAASMNDTCLILDEISQSNPQEIGSIVYLLGNGHGKQRAARTGGIRHAQKWRLMALSSGERTLAAHMNEGGKQVKAGQEARLLDIPATDRTHGAFDHLHGLPDGRAFADSLKRATSEHYGVMGLAFIRHLMDCKEDLPKRYAEMQSLPDFEASDGLEARAAGTFALLAMAGELATDFNLTGWTEGEAIEAAILGFQLWRNDRGAGNTEARQILRAVQDFINAHGDSRFSNLVRGSNDAKVPNRAGWFEDKPQGRVFYLTSGAIQEAAIGHDIRQITGVLHEAGWLADAANGGKNSITRTIEGRKVRVYPVCPQPLEVD